MNEHLKVEGHKYQYLTPRKDRSYWSLCMPTFLNNLCQRQSSIISILYDKVDESQLFHTLSDKLSNTEEDLQMQNVMVRWN